MKVTFLVRTKFCLCTTMDKSTISNLTFNFTVKVMSRTMPTTMVSKMPSTMSISTKNAKMWWDHQMTTCFQAQWNLRCGCHQQKPAQPTWRGPEHLPVEHPLPYTMPRSYACMAVQNRRSWAPSLRIGTRKQKDNSRMCAHDSFNRKWSWMAHVVNNGTCR